MGPEKNALFSNVVLLRDFHSKRSSSWDRTGGNRDWIDIAPGQTHVLLDEQGAGCIKHFYWTYIVQEDEERRLNLFRGLVLRAFWNGSSKPSVEVPLGDFFGVTNGLVRPIGSLAFTINPGGMGGGPDASWGFNCYLPMPFASGGRLEIENQGQQAGRLWFHVDYELYGSEPLPPEAGLLHAHWRREQRTEAVAPPEGQAEGVNLTGEENYVILDVSGDGQFAGYFLTVVNSRRDWWGEGDDMIFIDGEGFPPSIHGTGTEEIFGGGACPCREYSTAYSGFHCIENRAGYRWWGTNGMYRFYLTDPIRFGQSIRVTIEHGHGNDRANDYSSVAFWYQRGVNELLEELPPLSSRQVNFQD